MDLALDPPWMMHAPHGDVDRVIEQITRAAAAPSAAPVAAEQAVARRYSQSAVLPVFLEVLEAAAHADSLCAS
jgi:hypothetical protein